jgi:choline dehydrogenase
VCGVDRLRIADASIVPIIPSAGTDATALMIGEKAASLLQAQPRSRGAG